MFSLSSTSVDAGAIFPYSHNLLTHAFPPPQWLTLPSACLISIKKHLKNSPHFILSRLLNFRYHTPFLIHSTLGTLSMNKFKLALLTAAFVGLFACTTTQQPKKTVKTRYLKNNISQAELNNPKDYKRYYYSCRNSETGSNSYLTTYFPLSRESRMKDNFGIYFQLDGGKAVPFDHVENRTLNARGNRFEVIYRSYEPIDGSYVDLIARENNSVYYKNNQGMKSTWLNCREG